MKCSRKNKFVIAGGLVCAITLCIGILTGTGRYIQRREIETISRKEALADYDSMWEFLEENYPLFGVAERKYGLSVDALRANYRSQIEGLGQSRIDFCEYYEKMQECIGKFRQTGHLAIVSPSSYQSRMKELEPPKGTEIQDGQERWRYQLFSDPTARKRYDYLAKEYGVNLEVQAKADEENLEFRDISTDIGYVKIHSFHNSYISKDQKKLSNWFTENANKKFIIIDITGNGGGSSMYWINLIVAPNLDRKLSWTGYYLTSYGEESREQFAIDGVTAETLNPNPDDLLKLPNVNWEDLSNADYYGTASIKVKPAFEKKVCDSQFFLLVDNVVFSAADAFAMFCKDTGFATVAGVNTEGDGGGTNVYETRLPNSGLILRYRAMHGLNKDGSSNVEFGTTPDVLFQGRWGRKNVNLLGFCLDYIESIE